MQRRTRLHLYDVCRFLRVLLEQEHGRSIRVDVEPLYHLRGLGQTHIYITKAHVVFVGKRGELGTRAYGAKYFKYVDVKEGSEYLNKFSPCIKEVQKMLHQTS